MEEAVHFYEQIPKKDGVPLIFLEAHRISARIKENRCTEVDIVCYGFLVYAVH